MGEVYKANDYDLAADGKHIVALTPQKAPQDQPQQQQNHVVFLLNFYDELKRRVPLK